MPLDLHLAELAAVLAALQGEDRAWSREDIGTSLHGRHLNPGRLENLLPELEGLGYVGRRVGEALDVYRLSPLGRRTLHHWLDTGQWRPSTGQVVGR